MTTETPSDDAEAGEASAAAAPKAPHPPAEPAGVPPLPDFSEMLAEAAASSIDLLNDVDLDVKVELGRTQLTVEHILRLTNGSVVELDKLAGDPVDILVNEQLIARGEVLVVNDNFCVRINEIVPGVSEQIKQAH
ncbi:MAG: flagellar motor switch protein FliN [Sedimentisphaerales bacterium]|nr:flagellar motor switch protein FliN [Sedimentisphaerales bacterium]